MFRLEPLRDVFPLDRHQILDEIFTGVEHHGKISEVWLNGHQLHVASQDGSKLFTFDAMVTEDDSQGVQAKKQNHFDISSPSCIVGLLFTGIDTKLTYVVHSHGQIECWSNGSLQDSDWSRVAEFNLMVDDNFDRVCSAVLCNSVIVWCQRSSAKVGHYAVCQKHLTGTEKAQTTPQCILLNQCPYCELICLQDTVIIWPRYTSNGQLFLLWTPSTDTLQIVTSSKGLIEKRIIGRNEDWNSILLQNMGTISKATISRITGLIKYKEDALLIGEDGNVMSLNRHGVVRQKFKLSKMDELEIDQICDWFIYRFALAAVTSSQIIRFYSLDTGAMLYELNFSEYGSVLHPVPRHGSTDMMVLWNQTTLNCLQVCEAEKLQEYIPTSDAVQLLRRHGSDHQATHAVVDNFCKNDDTVPLHDRSLDFFKSPTVFLSVLQKVENSQNLTQNMGMSADLEQSLERYQSGKASLIEDKLNDDLADLLAQFLTLKQTQKDVVLGELNTASCHSDFKIQTQVIHLLQNLSQTGRIETCESLEVLANHFPREVTETMVSLLIDSGQSIDEKLWSFVLSTETAVKCTPIFELVCRLLFTEQPQKLLGFVQLAMQKKDNAVSVTAFTRKKEKLELYERALQCLPCVEDSKNWTDAVRSQVQLILHCNEDMYCVRKALLLLLEYELWQDAIELVQENADNNQNHNELFHLLLVKILKEPSVLNALYDDVWNVIPQNMSVTNLLQVLEENINQENYRICSANRVQCDRTEDVQLVAVQSQLLKMLQSQ